ncbi:MAG: DUF4268 domain-containing protein [Candidatus Diapherotrites archaeon]|nr:DUF4268 domain-containing protein [Candidatus Diapherotrites archaeon]
MGSFGNLKQVHLRELWKNEASDFTEWLSHKENLDMLATELKIPLELVEREKAIGGFSADLVAKIPNPDSESEEYVVIENQLEDSDHDHLGKLITYASGVEAKIVILICKDLREEHRTAIDWLNEISSGEVKFFVVRIEAWQIDDSRPAPKFNIVCEPDYWAKNLKQSVDIKKDLTETKKMQLEFWNSFMDFLKNKKSNLKSRKVYPQHWCDLAIGTSKGYLSLVMDTRQNLVSAAFYSANDPDKKIFQHLFSKKDAIEKDIGAPLVWMELPDKKASRIKIEKQIEVTNKTQWQVAFEFLKEEAEKIQRIFPKYLKDIDDE